MPILVNFALHGVGDQKFYEFVRQVKYKLNEMLTL